MERKRFGIELNLDGLEAYLGIRIFIFILISF